MKRTGLLFVALLAVTSLSARSIAAIQQQWRTERRTVGDTTIVRTVGAPPNAGVRRLEPVLSFGRASGPAEYVFGGITELKRAHDGSLWLFDSKSHFLRKYDSTGQFLRTVGRYGEVASPHASVTGMALGGRGKVLLWDEAFSYLHLFTEKGEHSESWGPRLRKGMMTSPTGSVATDSAGNIYVSWIAVPDSLSVMTASQLSELKVKLLRYEWDGGPVDSLDVPSYGAPQMRVQPTLERPFFPEGVWALSPHGYFVASHGDRYAVDLLLPSGRVTRIERDLPAVPISVSEQSDALDIVESRMRGITPGYRYRGPALPETRPPVNALRVDDDARIWVSVATAAVRVPDGERTRSFEQTPPPTPGRSSGRGSVAASDANRANTQPVRDTNGDRTGGASGNRLLDPYYSSESRFRVPLVFDVFATDGRFLGRVPMPKGVVPHVMKGDYVWSVTRDSLEVQHVVKFRIVPPLGP